MMKPTLLAARVIVVLSMLACGCASESPSEQMRERQSKLLDDPFGSGPTFESLSEESKSASPDRTDVSGGGLLELDRDAIGRDLESLLDPTAPRR